MVASTPNRSLPVALSSSLTPLLGAISGGILMSFTVLRETVEFWRNSGGYPHWVRDVVLHGFHPMVVFCGGVLLYASWRLILLRRVSLMMWLVQSALVGLGVLLFTMSLTIAVTNNVLNVLDGRPLHSHSGH